jgi:hypothetical protein|tara:strand:- start:59 stop:232 length:174 start_codon:yes stop_codon:yes gene_type:complete
MDKVPPVMINPNPMRVVCSMGFLVVTVMIKDKINDYLKATLRGMKKGESGLKGRMSG